MKRDPETAEYRRIVKNADHLIFIYPLWRRDADWVTVKDVVLKFCGVRRVKRLLFAGVKDSSEEKRTQWLDRVYRSIAPADRGISE